MVTKQSHLYLAQAVRASWIKYLQEVAYMADKYNLSLDEINICELLSLAKSYTLGK